MKTPPAILDDAPKTEPEEDRLGYQGFARRLAASLSSIQADNGYVIGLQGPWGSGKSTVINFVKAFLRPAKARGDLVVVDFAPWLISGHQDLIAGFFKVLREAVSLSDARRSEAVHKAKKVMAKHADPVLTGIGAVTTALLPHAALWAAPAGKAAGAALGKSLETWAKEPSLQVAYSKLRSALRGDQRRFVVFVDDLDRLEPDEIKAIAQMVKSVGGLPRVTYVLAYDRDIVWPPLVRKPHPHLPAHQMVGRGNGLLGASSRSDHRTSVATKTARLQRPGRHRGGRAVPIAGGRLVHCPGWRGLWSLALNGASRRDRPSTSS